MTLDEAKALAGTTENPHVTDMILRARDLLLTVPVLATPDSYEPVTVNSSRKRNATDRPKTNIMFIADTLNELVETDDPGGFMDDPDDDDLERRDVRLQLETIMLGSDQLVMNEIAAQIIERIMAKNAWVDVATYIILAGVTCFPPEIETSEEYLTLAISLQLGYSVIGGRPRQFVL